MKRVRNPFRATLGATPPYLAGRENELDDFDNALINGPGTHERISLVTGLRGVGKTVLLNEFESIARSHSWWVINETANAGFTGRIRDEAYRIAESIHSQAKTRVSGVSTPWLELNFEQDSHYQPEPTLRHTLTELLTVQSRLDKKLGQEPVGVLITLDELHYSLRDEVIEFATTIQHLVREDAEIAVAIAGIPSAISPLLASNESQNPVTFLRRANRIELDLVDDEYVRDALRKPLEEIDTMWEPEALEMAVEACAGYPFMIQLVGQYAFINRDGHSITTDSVHKGVEKAQSKLGQLVHEPALNDLSDMDRTFLLAMAQDETGPTYVSALSERLGKDPQYVQTYRRRLIESEIIRPTGHGTVDFELPYLREYIREHAAYRIFNQSQNSKE